MKERLSVGILTPLRLDDHASVRDFLELLIRSAPDLSPELCGNHEPIRIPFRSVDEAISCWRPPFLWKRTAGARTEGSVFFANNQAHSAAFLTVSGRQKPTAQALRFMRNAATGLAADFAYLHLLTARETTSETYDTWYPIDVGVTSHDLRRGIPNLCWATVFGPPYVRLIGSEALLSAPCFRAEMLSPEHAYLQITPDIEDPARDFGEFEGARRRVREHLGESLFGTRSVGDSQVRVPKFEL